MATHRYPMTKYATWVRNQVLGASPMDRMKEWQRDWDKAYTALIAADSILELIPLIVARWEFLGGLFRGECGATPAPTAKKPNAVRDGTNYTDAVEYGRAFLEKVQPLYRDVHDLTKEGQSGSSFFTMLRNKPFHGMTPAAAAFTGNTEVIGWWVGTNDIDPNLHLQVDPEGKLHVSGDELRKELLASMDLFIDYLTSNQGPSDIDTRVPQSRWQRGLWWRYKPQGMPVADWMALGESPHGLPK